MEKIVNQTLTTHVAILLDRSVSMAHLKVKTIQVADELVSYLAEQSVKMGQEWKISVYTFGSDVTNKIWSMDVLRLPSMKEHYHIDGNTALVDAALLALDDGDKIPEHYGNHAHLVYLITDGEENWSLRNGIHGSSIFGRVPSEKVAATMKARIDGLQDNRTIAVLAPSNQGVREVEKLGFKNIFLWDTSSEAGLESASRAIKTSASTYMEARTQGAVGLRAMKGSLFVGGNVDAAAVKAADLKPLSTEKRQIIRVTPNEDAFEKVVKPVTKSRLKPEMGSFVEIEKFVRRVNEGKFAIGRAYYELVKSETIQGDKGIAVVEVNTNKVFVGAGARQLLGLPEERRRVRPEPNGKYQIFVQSSSTNRHLPIGSHVLLLK